MDNVNLVVGAGFSGATAARLIAQQTNENVIVVDKKGHTGGNSYDYKDENGIYIHKYGSHIFHTNNEKVWKFVNSFGSFNTYMHKVYALIDGVETTIPFNLNTLYAVFPSALAQNIEKKLFEHFQYGCKVPILEFQKLSDTDLNFVSKYIYDNVFKNYTLKQWGKTPDEIDSDVSARVPVLISRDNRYFQDKYQGIPYLGYAKLISNMLSHPNIKVLLNTDYKDLKNYNFKRIFYTGSIDEFFDYRFGTLPYRSVEFELEEHEFEYYQKNSVVNYPNNYDFTRIHEYKYYTNAKSPRTVIAKEYPCEYKIGMNEPYYPIANVQNDRIYDNYCNYAKKYENVYFLGRLGDYKYYDMDKAVERAMNLVSTLLSRSEEKVV